MTAIFRVGLKNVLGSNWTRTRHRWRGRAVLLEQELNADDGMRASVYFLIEMNRRAERRSLGSMLPGWQVARSTRGRNDAYSDPAVHRLLSWVEEPLGTVTGTQRYVLIARYAHVGSGLEWTGATTHLSSSVHTTPQLAERSRRLQAERLVELCREHRVDVVAADLNNVAVRPDTPRGLLEAAGYRDWRALTDVVDVDLDSHRPYGTPLTREGRHLDAIYVADRVRVLNGRMQATQPASSDHLGLVCTVQIDPR